MRVTFDSAIGFQARKQGAKQEAKIVQLPIEYKNHTEPASPEAARAVKNRTIFGFEVIKPVNAVVATKRAGAFTVMIYPDTIRNLLSDENGKSERLVKKFISVYTDYIHAIEGQYEYDEPEPEVVAEPIEDDDQEYLVGLALTEEEERALEEFAGFKVDDPRFIDSVINKLLGGKPISSLEEGRVKIDLDKQYELDEFQMQDMSERAYRAAVGFFEISKKGEKGKYDFSYQKDKLELLSLAERLETYYGPGILDDILDNAEDKNGRPDYKLACNIGILLENSDIEVSAKRAAEVLKRFTARDFEHREDILKALICMNLGTFIFSDTEREFDEVFALSFDKQGKFDPFRFSAIYAIDEMGQNWMDESEATQLQYPFYKCFIKQKIFEYMEQNTDAQGDFWGSEESAGEFFEQAEKPMFNFKKN